MSRALYVLRVVRRVRLAIVLLGALAGGFGLHARSAGTETVESAAVKSTVRTYETAIMHGDGQTACMQLTDEAKQQLLASASRAGMGGDCVAVGNAMKRYVDSLIARAPSPERAQEAQRMMDDPPIEVVSMDGATATARVQGVSDETIPLVHTELGWRISGFTNLGG
jgi:hypothetical protein